VLDWTGALVAGPAFDVAFTWFLLRHPPLEASPALRPVIGAAAGLLARRFVRRYRAVDPTADLARLDWYAALHAVRVLTDLAAWQRDGDPRAISHPWRLVAPGAAAVVAAATGIDVAGSGPS
jgi:aminoglycoside phosphotransferase (APT) family kinase protein